MGAVLYEWSGRASLGGCLCSRELRETREQTKEMSERTVSPAEETTGAKALSLARKQSLLCVFQEQQGSQCAWNRAGEGKGKW